MKAKYAPSRQASAAGRIRLSVGERRQQLLSIGERLFTKFPYDEVSTEAVAAEAGISHGLLFHYFGTKRDFYVAVLEVMSDQMIGEASPSQEGDPFERLESGLRGYFAFVDRKARAFAALMGAGVGTDPKVHGVVEATRHKFVDVVRANLPPIPPGKEKLVRPSVRAWVGLVEAAALDWIEHRDLTVEELLDFIVPAFIAMVPGAELVEPPPRWKR